MERAELAREFVGHMEGAHLALARNRLRQRIPDHLDIRKGEESFLQDLGRAKLVPPVDDVDLLAAAGQEDGILDRHVSAADDRHVGASEKCAVAGRAVGHAHACEFLLTGDAELSVARAGRQDHGFGLVDFVLRVHLLDVLGQLELRDFRGHEFCTEVVGVVTHFHGQIHAGDARKARIVVNLIGIDDLAAAHEVLFDNDK